MTTVHSPEPVSSRLQTVLLPAIYRGVHTVITVSDETRDLLVRTLGVPTASVKVVLNGVPVPAPRRRPSVREGAVRAGTLGRLVREKGFDVLLDAVRGLDAVPPVHLRIGGEGPERPALESRARGLPVTFVGEVVDTAAFLSELDVFCLSSRREALPFALLEAMATGVPCITTDVGQIRSALGSAVLVVPPEDPQSLASALQHLASDPAARESLGARGRALIAASFDVRAMAASTMQLYEDALVRQRRGRFGRSSP
jgi:glycosyltransferase involved in cell wall biosynthesis